MVCSPAATVRARGTDCLCRIIITVYTDRDARGRHGHTVEVASATKQEGRGRIVRGRRRLSICVRRGYGAGVRPDVCGGAETQTCTCRWARADQVPAECSATRATERAQFIAGSFIGAGRVRGA